MRSTRATNEEASPRAPPWPAYRIGEEHDGGRVRIARIRMGARVRRARNVTQAFREGARDGVSRRASGPAPHPPTADGAPGDGRRGRVRQPVGARVDGRAELGFRDRGSAAKIKPAGSDLEAVEHIVFLMLENRSYDHYFGAYPRGRRLRRPSEALARRVRPGLPGWIERRPEAQAAALSISRATTVST